MDYRIEIENLSTELIEAFTFGRSITPLLVKAVNMGFTIEINPTNIPGLLKMNVATGPKSNGPMRWYQSVVFDPIMLLDVKRQ